jgi:hypothetical protein
MKPTEGNVVKQTSQFTYCAFEIWQIDRSRPPRACVALKRTVTYHTCHDAGTKVREQEHGVEQIRQESIANCLEGFD